MFIVHILYFSLLINNELVKAHLQIINITYMQTTKTVPDFNEVQNGVTWIGGPTHELQRQHIPGYQGHIHGLFSENVYGKNFARVTSQCMNNRNQKGIDHKIDTRYVTSYKQEFEEPDNRKKQFINTAESLLNKLQQQEQYINEKIKLDHSKIPKSIQQVAPIDRIPVVGYMGHKPVYRPPRKQIKAPEEPQQVKLHQKTILQKMLKTGNADQKLFSKQYKQEPVVGYTGFLRGVKAENQYAQVYQQLAANSIRR